ncbi:5-oxoprolinase subunit B family protein [Cobetia sp. L2A1]|uniref:5-oxoprolinase subunit B family protein n=1 Tax=Cobetia sp. L2A1 TaxID=2686360 RepID=UPI001E41CAFC|nr:allophanate hydrolase subunit 1 [Cobetia sp. L2A1]
MAGLEGHSEEMRPELRLETVGMDTLIVRLFDSIEESNMGWVLAADSALRQVFGEALIDLVPSYTTLLLHYDVAKLEESEARARVSQALEDLAPDSGQQGQLHEVPVWYDDSVGPELEPIATRLGISVEALIERHCAHDYCVFALGFAPGYAFMGVLEEALTTPRLKTPRQKVAAGSVGIADRQTAIYPSRSPGGWNILGRTPLTLFGRNAAGEPSSLFMPGDRVRFVSISREEFVRLGGDVTPLEERS